MSHPKNRSAYNDCFAIFDKVTESEKGIRIARDTRGSAQYLVARLNFARALQRQINENAFPPDDMRHYGTKYDEFTVRNPRQIDDKWWVYIEPMSKIIDKNVELL